MPTAIEQLREAVAEEQKRPGKRHMMGLKADLIVSACDEVANQDERVQLLRSYAATRAEGAMCLTDKDEILHLLSVANG